MRDGFFLPPIPVTAWLAWPTQNRNWVGLDVANRENDCDDGGKKEEWFVRVRQTSTFIVGHTRGRVAMPRTIWKEVEGVKRVPR